MKGVLLGSFLVLLSGQAGASTYYVSTSGNDSNPGSSSKPWKTIQHACNSVASGDTVLVHGGTYGERVTIKRPMTLENVSGESPVIDGSSVAVPQSDAGLVLINGVGKVLLQGFEIRNFKTTNSSLAPAGILVEGTEDSVTIRGNLIDHIENDGSQASNINAFGIQVYGNSPSGAITNLIIDHNEVRYTKTGNSETVTVDGNVNGFKITSNLVHDVNNIGIDCIGFEGVSPIKGQDQARNGYVGLNTVYNVSSHSNPAYTDMSADGLYVDGGTSIVIERNTVHNCDIGIEVASEHYGKVASSIVVRSNLVYASNVVGLSIGGYSSGVGGTQGCTFVNNTLFSNDSTDSGSGEFMIQFHTSQNVFENNLLYASSQGILISEASGAGSPGVASDYNLYFAPANESWSWGSSTYSTLKSFEQGSHGDSHSLFVDPKFVNASADNCHLSSNSPAIGAGIDLGSSIEGQYDLDGNPRVRGNAVDIGCYESTSAAAP
jgi:hypothetical protein